MAIASIPFMAAPDSARAVTAVYTASLLATVPIALALGLAFVLRGSSAQARMLVWRSTIAALVVILIGRVIPHHWIPWAVPSMLAVPLVALGRVQVTSAAAAAPDVSVVSTAFLVYLGIGVFLLSPTLLGWLSVGRMIANGTRLRDGDWLGAVDGVRQRLGLRRQVRVIQSWSVPVPMTWGIIRPVVLLPPAALRWNPAQREIVLLHELAHVAALDWLLGILSRVACATLWFHPGAWWVARRLQEDCELSCDERVLASGVRRSDYAELLVDAASRFLAIEPAVPLVRPDGIRLRLSAIVDARPLNPLARGWVATAAVCTAAVACPVSLVQLAPSRAVLDSLMTDTRWESRAYAVIGLASRADSLAAARSIAERDPSPRVRAWARYALGQSAAPTPRRSFTHE